MEHYPITMGENPYRPDGATRWICMDCYRGCPLKMVDSFSRFGIPKLVVTDNGPQFVSTEFNMFLERNGVKHITSSPHPPRTNGQKRLSIILFWYRITPHQSSNRSPAEAMFKRILNTLIDNIRPSIVSNLEFSRMKRSYNHDKHSKFRQFKAGDEGLIENELTRGFYPARSNSNHHSYYEFENILRANKQNTGDVCEPSYMEKHKLAMHESQQEESIEMEAEVKSN
ncbi:hypothetical protein RF11_14168 [Thelohanellus kitauei]|uniref:Integrase catalytic domain-containing protein n=1 Tax=Thelohanellus kitauei TaxID=669202 RepID=A0A0C2J374_THEKT|nr:hypothetical protein RF11_14168 [Thelohanellus kitauei]